MILKQLVLALITFIGVYTTANAQKVETFTLDGNTYYGTKAIPDDIVGFYQYEKTKEPIVDIKKNGTGEFQVHGVPAYPVEYWIQTDAKGVVQKRTGAVPRNYQVVLILKYGDNGQSGWKGEKKGQYDRIEVTMAFDQGYAIVLGERFRKI
jgi:hypothetical protein